MSNESVISRRNWLLNAVEPSTQKRFADKLRLVELTKGQVLLGQGQEVDAVYFPEGALIGLVSAMASGDTVQTAMLGWDGALGVFEACGSRRSAFLAEVQVSGAAWRMPAAAYREMFAASEALRINVHKYVELLLTEARQHVACNALHSVSSRLSRSILEALERSQDNRRLPVTKDVLAEMIGVQRTTASSSIATLERAGALTNSRGSIEVDNPALLERKACSCRKAMQVARREIYQTHEDVCDEA